MSLDYFPELVKEHDRKYVFATVQTMSRPEVLTQFSKDDFNYILIDEVHHAAVDSYKRIIGNYCLRCSLMPIRVFSSVILLFHVRLFVFHECESYSFRQYFFGLYVRQ